ncbi:hypothetical protein V8E52_003273 [Russula decolorans]
MVDFLECSDCFPALVLCKECCRKSHQLLPFHRVQKWTGKYFMPSWLREVGVCLQFGHSGDPCPNQIVRHKAFYALNLTLKKSKSDSSSDDILADEYPAVADQGAFQLGFGSSKPGRNDNDSNPVITIIDRSGVHEIGVRWCCCLNAPKRNMQLMAAGLFPATFRNPRTAFTFRVLEEFHLDNLECKTTPSQFISRLRRLTSDEFPNAVPGRYQELLRVSRLWRALITRKRFGFGYGENEDPKPGSMAIFCALCAQPGINLPEDWREYENRCHMRMKNPENDVPLSDGTGFMVSKKPYESHLKSAVERQQRSTCHDHRTVNNVNKHSSHLESTGIGATACIHGTFVPNSVVDFQKGEAQRNMDYSIFKALNFNMGGIEAALICYDVMCQWSVHVKDRVTGSRHLKIPDGLELRLGIGLFHIHGHQDTCLARSTRGMSTSHRREVIDDHMSDSNWKKLVDLVNAVSKRYRRALSGETLSSAAFDNIDGSASTDSTRVWASEEEHAKRERKRDVTVMNIYDIKMERLPSRAEILLELTEKEICASGHKGHAAWLASGLKIQEMQLSLQALVRKTGSYPTPDQKRDIALRCSWLQDKVDAFQNQAGSMLNAVSNDADDFWGDDYAREIYTGAEFDGVGDEEDDDGYDSAAENNHQTQLPRNSPHDGRINAEHISLYLPSHLGRSWCNRNAAEDLAKAELRIREGQLNDSLHHIRIALGHKSYLFRNNVCPARTQRLKTRAWAEVHAVESTVQHHAQVYNRAQQSMLDLGADASLLDRYKVLERQHLRTNTTVIAPNVRGQRNKSLPWFWSMDVRRDADVGAWMNDFYRVHWLRANAQKTRFFQHQEKFWKEKQGLIEPGSQPGHAAWAARQSAMWHLMAMQADSRFTGLLKGHPPPDFAKVIRPHSNSHHLSRSPY